MEEESPKILLILGTGRRGRKSEMPALYLLKQLKKFDLRVELIDVKQYGFKSTGDTNKQLQKKMKEAKGYVIITPEYNHGYPGELKLLLDAFYLGEYENKPVLLCSANSGNHGGAAVVEQLKPVCIELGMIPMRKSIFFNEIGDLFDKKFNMKDKDHAEKINQIIELFRAKIGD